MSAMRDVPWRATLLALLACAVGAHRARAQADSAGVTILAGAALRAEGIQTLADALRAVPGLYIEETGEFGGGTATAVPRGSNGRQLLVLLDEAPLNLAGGPVDLAHFSLDNVLEIRVLRGNWAARYGPDATAGVVLVTSGRASAGGGVAARAGTPGARALTAEAATVDHGRFSLGASLLASDAVVVPSNAYNRGVVAASASVPPRSGMSVDVALGVTDLSYRYVGMVPGTPDSSGLLSPFHDGGTRLTWSARISQRLGSAAALSVFGGSARRDIGHNDSINVASPSAPYRIDARNIDRHDRWGASLDASIKGVRLEAGFSVDHTRAWGSSTLFRSGSFLVSSYLSHTNDHAWFASAAGRVPGIGRMTWSAALRNDGFQGGLPGVGSWRVDAGYALTPTARIGASAASGGGGIGYLPDTSFAFAVDPGIRPERTLTYEAGLQQRFAGGGASIELDGVVTRTDHVFGLVPIAGGVGFGNYLLTNLGATRAAGAELVVDLTPRRALNVRANLAYLPVRVTQVPSPYFASNSFMLDSALMDRPDLLLGADAQWQPTRLATLGLDVTSVGERFVWKPVAGVGGFARGRAGAYAVVDAYGRLGLWRGLTAVARLDNALNERYDVEPRFPGRPRTILAGLSLGS